MTDRYESVVEEALSTLQVARKHVLREISAYPAPISGCDAQFNQLLSDRTRIANAIQALETKPFIPTHRMLEPGTSLESR